MKKNIILILYILSIYACERGWSENDKKNFLYDFKQDGGNENLGLCLLGCLEEEYINYESAQFFFKSNQEGVSNQLIKCLSGCKKILGDGRAKYSEQ
tara:strand:- start:393 stop:683 length:291 start_codon:yes stop_codon:yes gene_type:complete